MPQECKLIIFDLDGVLLDAKDIHFRALNHALRSVDSKYIISKEDHIAKFDGLPTATKLNILMNERGFPRDKFYEVEKVKQEITIGLINDIEQNSILIALMQTLKYDGFILAVASNSIHKTIKTALSRLGISNYIDFVMSNGQVTYPKPNPEMYLRCMIEFGVSPSETLIVEDSEIGRKAVLASGANLCPVNSVDDLTYELVSRYAGKINMVPRWKDDKLNIIIPMAGAGSRFADAGYTFPKPLIEVNGKPMIQTVVENLNIDAHYIFLVNKDHYEKYSLQYLLNLIAPDCDIIQVDGITEGAACTTLLAAIKICNNDPLLIANSDQYLEWNSSQFMYAMSSGELDAGLVTFTATHPKWSFARVENGRVVEVAEKKPISNIATAGVYYWRHGSEYTIFAKRMIERNIRTNNEFYVCPVFNQAIESGKTVKPFHIDKMWGLGTPEDLNTFLGEHK